MFREDLKEQWSKILKDKTDFFEWLVNLSAIII